MKFIKLRKEKKMRLEIAHIPAIYIPQYIYGVLDLEYVRGIAILEKYIGILSVFIVILILPLFKLYKSNINKFHHYIPIHYDVKSGCYCSWSINCLLVCKVAYIQNIDIV